MLTKWRCVKLPVVRTKLIALIALSACMLFAGRQEVADIARGNTLSPLAFLAPTRTNDLSASDIALYRQLFRAQNTRDWEAADNALLKIENQLLMGTALAERYLSESYPTTSEELVAWLRNYSDQPEASRIARLAKSKGASLAELTESQKIKPSVEGVGRVDTIGGNDMPQSWFSGLTAWRNQQYSKAANLFGAAAQATNISPWQEAAAYYWQFRAYERMGNDLAAERALAGAARHSLTFYGMLAQNKQGETLRLMAQAPYVADSLRSHPATMRAHALSQIGELNSAERELRTVFKQLDTADRSALITLASEMNLPNLQVRLSRLPELNDEERIFATYPMPQWLSAQQLRMDNSLMLAISRQESSFAAEVQSHAGATGLMQLMPATANYIWNKSGESVVASLDDSDIPAASARIASSDLHDPRTNLLLGQEYVGYLTNKPYIGTNIVHILAGYNAGPGMVHVWNKSAKNIQDPLLYVESIPYTETRHYVMQVLANYWAYQSLMGQNTDSLSALTEGQWPRIDG